jgi:hypothetical protein
VALDDSKRKIVAGILRPGDAQPELREIGNDARQGDLVVTAVGNPPASAEQGTSFSATDTVARAPARVPVRRTAAVVRMGDGAR